MYRLITRHTLEEKIMGLQRFKLNIANSVISQENASLSSMGTDQLLDLFHVRVQNESKSGIDLSRVRGIQSQCLVRNSCVFFHLVVAHQLQVGESKSDDRDRKAAQPGLKGMLEVCGVEISCPIQIYRGTLVVNCLSLPIHGQDLEKIWDEASYEDYDVEKFMSGMSGAAAAP